MLTESPPATERPAPQRRLLPSLSLLSLVVYTALGAVLTVLLPNQVAALDPEHKVENLAAVTSVSFAFTIFAQPLVGALSDRTRSRLGRRLPWMLGGALIGGMFLVAMGGLGSLLWIGVFWVVIQFALNAVDAPLAASVPDRYPRRRWGTASAVVGIGTMTGGALGAVAATRFVDELPVAYAGLGGLVIIGASLFVLVNREPSTAREVTQDAATGPGGRRPAFDLRAFLAGFWVSPRRHPDFAWAFAARMVFLFGYTLVSTYLLYVITDYIGLPLADANALVGTLSALGFVTMLVAVALAGWWSDRVGRRKAFVYAACGMLAGALLIPLLLPTALGMMIFAAAKGLAFGIFLSSGAALFTEALPHAGRAAGKDLGILNVAINVPQSVAPIAAAGLIAFSGGYAVLFAVAIVSVLAAGVLFTRIRSSR